METKKVRISMIAEIEANAFEELAKCVDHHIERFVDTGEWPEIKSITSGEVSEIKEDKSDIINGIEKREFDNYTVEEVINILSIFPKDYEFLCCGESDYAIWVDHNHGMVSIDKGNWITDNMNQIKDSLQNNK
jgi:hypothetical protein